MPATAERAVDTFGATWSALGCGVELIVTDRAALPAATELLVNELAAIDLACSRFRPDSELMGVQSARGRRVAVSAVFVDAIDVALKAARATDGLVDPTVAAAVAAFGYDRDFGALPADGPAPVPPPTAESTWRDIELDRVRGCVRVPLGLQLDFGATAKALAADRAATLVARACDCGVLVSLGGDIAVAGMAPVGGWGIRIQESPGALTDAPRGSSCEIAVSDGGVATSSVRHRRWRRGERSYHHIVDPRTGRPAESPWRTVTVAAATCVAANTASTAAIVMGESAVPWLEAHRLPARLVRVDGQVELINSWPDEA